MTYSKGVPITYIGPIRCRTCSTERPHTDFYVRNSRRRTDCRFCCQARARVSAERVEVADERWMTRREGILRRKYGIGNADYEALLHRQHGVCALCGQIPECSRANTRTGRTWTPFQVEHCHETGQVRGLTCITCNRTIAEVERIGPERIVAYLRSSSLTK